MPVGLGVDGAASQEANQLGAELRQALYTARLRGGPTALTAREALALGTIGGARCLGRDDELGSLRDRASSPTSRCGGSTGSATPASTTRSPRWCSVRRPRWSCCWSAAGPVVERGELRTVDERDLARRTRRAHRALIRRSRA